MARLPLWIDLRGVPVNKRLPYLKAAAEAKADALLLDKGDPHVARKEAPVVVVGADGVLRKGGKRVGRLLDVADAKGQATAAASKGLVVVHAKSWRVIPLENLVAARRKKPGTLYALASTPEEATLFANTLETGVHGIVLAPANTLAIRATDGLLRSNGPKPTPRAPKEPLPANTFLHTATITSVEDAGLGDRVCVDTTSQLKPGEGLLVGSTARGFVLVHAETEESEFVRARPFRINAGALHMYVLAPDGKTRYLSELAAGDQVLVAGKDGKTRTVTLGRAKLERRPHTLVKWDGGMAMLQTAETIRLVRPDGRLVAVTELKPKDEVLVHAESAARHFGMATDARLEER